MSYFVLYLLSKDRLSRNILKCLLYLLISIYLLTGQFSDRSTAALNLSFPAALVHSQIICGPSFISSLQDTLSYPEFVKFYGQTKLKKECSDIRKCVERMITKRDFASFIAAMFAAYVAKELEFVDVGKAVCSLDEALFSVDVTIILRRQIHFWTDSTSKS